MEEGKEAVGKIEHIFPSKSATSGLILITEKSKYKIEISTVNSTDAITASTNSYQQEAIWILCKCHGTNTTYTRVYYVISTY